MKSSFVLSAALGIFAILTLANAESSLPPNASLTLTKDQGTGLFILTLKDPEGIQSFFLDPQNSNLPYSGDLPQCPQTKKIDNIAYFNDPADFEPPMKAFISDCQGSKTDFTIEKTSAGKFATTKISPEPAPAAQPAPETPLPKEETSENISTSEAEKGVTYPIPELGNCGGKDECKTYCEDTAHIETCLNFAEQHGLLSADELDKGKKFKEILKSGGGPGSCKSESACETYCSDVSRLDECVAFAEENGFVKGEKLNEIKKIHSIIKSGKTLPGNCTNKIACEAYCKNSEHLDECFAFAKENGLMSAEELKEAEKFLPLMKSGQMPGACKSKEECEAYCDTDEHMDECIDFGARHGLISEEELAIVKKTGGKGPGGCKGRACKDYCENPQNQKACFEFAKEHGILKEEDLKHMEEGMTRLKEELKNMPEDVRSCLETALGPEGLRAIEGGEFLGGRDLGEKMKICFEENLPQEFKDKFEVGPEGEFRGPGGCKTRDECEAYCMNNPEACGSMHPEGGDGEQGDFREGGHMGPGGCATPEECAKYCEGGSHESECGGFQKGFNPPVGESRGGGPGDCSSVEECRAYCTSHPDKCGGGSIPPGANAPMPPFDQNQERHPELQGFPPPTFDQNQERHQESQTFPPPTLDQIPAQYQEQYLQETHGEPTTDGTQGVEYKNQYDEVQKQYEGEYKQEYDTQYQEQNQEQQYPSSDQYQQQYQEPYGGEHQEQYQEYQNSTYPSSSRNTSAYQLATILLSLLNLFR